MSRSSPRSRWSPRVRIGLRALLLTVAIIAIGLAWLRYRAEQQRLAVQWILDRGGEVIYEHEWKQLRPGDYRDVAHWRSTLPRDSWLVTTLGPHYFHQVLSISFDDSQLDGEAWRLAHAYDVRKVTFSNCNLNKEVLTALGKCQRVEWILSSHCDCDQQGLSYLAKLPRLKDLQFEAMSFDEIGMQHLGNCRKLECLAIQHCTFDSEHFTHLRDLHYLQTAGVASRSVGDNELSIVAGWSNLDRLQLGESITDAGLPKLAGLGHLTKLGFDASMITDEGAESVAKLPALTHLQFHQCKVSPEAIQRISQQHPTLTVRAVP